MNLPAEREKAWRDILTESSFALGREPLTGYALRAATVAFENVNSHIPTRLLHEIYRRSMRLTDASGAPVYWDARAITTAYDKYLAELEGQAAEFDPSYLLPENAAGACPKCGGTEWEQMPDGTVRKGCPHDTPVDDAPVYGPFINDQITLMRESLKQTDRPKPPSVVPQKRHMPKLVCQSCGERWSTYYGFKPGDNCARLLTEGDVRFCGGVLA